MTEQAQSPLFTLDDFRPALLRLGDAEAPFALAGGLAVSAWAERLLTTEEKAQFGHPLHSKDMELRGARWIAELLISAFREQGAEPHGLAVAQRKNAPGSSGRVFAFNLELVGRSTTVEVLERLPLLDKSVKLPPEGSALRLGRVPVLDPCSLFICKLHAWNTRPAEHRNKDLEHLKVLSKVIPRFLATASKLESESLARVAYSPRDDAQRLHRVLLEAKSPVARITVPLPPAEALALERVVSAV